MKVLKSFTSAVSLLAMIACVTVNIYFPEAAAEQALRGVARDILNEQPGAGTNGPAPAGEKSKPASPGAGLGLSRVLAMLVPEARADEQPTINVQTPVAQKIQSSLKERQAKLAPYYRSGAIGLSSNFQPVPRDLSQVPLNERVMLKKLLADDAQDRSALFSEIARANGHPEWQQNLKTTFDRVFFEELPQGYWYQDAQGNWRQK